MMVSRHSSGVDTTRIRCHLGRSPVPRPNPCDWRRRGLAWVYSGQKRDGIGDLAVEIWPTGETYVAAEAVLPAVLYGSHYASGSITSQEVLSGFRAVTDWVSDFFGWVSPSSRLVPADLAAWEIVRLDPSDTFEDATGLLSGLLRVLADDRTGKQTVSDHRSTGRTVQIRESNATLFRAYEKAPDAARHGQANPGKCALRAEWQLRMQGGRRPVSCADSVAVHGMLSEYGTRTVQLLGKAAAMSGYDFSDRVALFMRSRPASGRSPEFAEVVRLLGYADLMENGHDQFLRDSLSKPTYYRDKARLRELVDGLPTEVPTGLLGDLRLVLARDLRATRQATL